MTTNTATLETVAAVAFHFGALAAEARDLALEYFGEHARLYEALAYLGQTLEEALVEADDDDLDFYLTVDATVAAFAAACIAANDPAEYNPLNTRRVVDEVLRAQHAEAQQALDTHYGRAMGRSLREALDLDNSPCDLDRRA